MAVQTLKTDSWEMEFLRFGKQDGEKFVILPGLSLKSVMGSAEGIAAAYSLIAENYDVYLFDHVKEEPEGYDIAGMASDVLEAFRRLNLEHIHLMGVSMGGMIAQAIAVREPERIASLILCSTCCSTEYADPCVFDRWRELAEKKDSRALMEAFGETVYTPSFYEKYKDIILSGAGGVSDLDYRNFLVSLNAVRGFDISEELRNISCPVLVLGAGEDRVIGTQSSKELIRRLPCKYFIYEGCGHGVYDEAPDYLMHISGFLADLK